MAAENSICRPRRTPWPTCFNEAAAHGRGKPVYRTGPRTGPRMLQ